MDSWTEEEIDMKGHWIFFFTLTGLLVIPTVAQDTGGRSTNSVVRPQVENHGDRITVDVWSSAESPQPEAVRVSTDFAAAGLNSAFKMENTERKIENFLRMGFPLGAFWIQTDLEGIDDSLRLAALSVRNDADREALQQLENQSNRLRLWSNWLIDQNRNLALTEYYISSSTLDNDERFQNSVACTKFLVSMLTSRRLAEDDSCL
jgi:hypothetical protein